MQIDFLWFRDGQLVDELSVSDDDHHLSAIEGASGEISVGRGGYNPWPELVCHTSVSPGYGARVGYGTAPGGGRLLYLVWD